MNDRRRKDPTDPGKRKREYRGFIQGAGRKEAIHWQTGEADTQFLQAAGRLRNEKPNNTNNPPAMPLSNEGSGLPHGRTRNYCRRGSKGAMDPSQRKKAKRLLFNTSPLAGRSWRLAPSRRGCILSFFLSFLLPFLRSPALARTWAELALTSKEKKKKKYLQKL